MHKCKFRVEQDGRLYFLTFKCPCGQTVVMEKIPVRLALTGRNPELMRQAVYRMYEGEPDVDYCDASTGARA